MRWRHLFQMCYVSINNHCYGDSDMKMITTNSDEAYTNELTRVVSSTCWITSLVTVEEFIVDTLVKTQHHYIAITA